MKTLLIAISTLLVLSSFSQPWEKIEGSGTIKKETRQVGNYTAISSSGSWDVMVAYGSSNSIQIEGDDNVLPYIVTEVQDGTLKIKSKDGINVRTNRRITVYVSLSKLTGIALSGSGDIIGNGDFYNDGKTSVKLSGSGKIRIDFKKVDELSVAISGSGNVRLSGTASNVSARVSGSGNADCEDVITDAINASIAGSGSVRITTNKSLEASIAGSGSVYYKGAATDITKHVAGSGRVVKR